MKMGNFDDWLAAVNAICEAAYGFDATHWADGPTVDEFEAGTTPAEYAYDILPEYADDLKAFRVHTDDREKYPILRGRINARKGGA